MKGGRLLRTALVLAAGLLAGACSTTRLLEQGEFRLEKNVIDIREAPDFKETDLDYYIRQQANSSIVFGWNPLLNIYNWSGRDPDRWVNKIIRGFGEAPVVYDPDLVQVSVDNIRNHLEYIGYYGSEVDGRPEVPKGRRVTVRYEIRPGRRYPIRDIIFDIPQRGDIAEDFFADTVNMTLRRGDYLSEAALAAESVRSAAHLRNLGYFGLTQNNYVFLADTLAFPGEAVLTMRLLEHARNDADEGNARPLVRHRFGQVTIAHPQSMHFREKYLRKVNGIVPGRPYSETLVSNTYARLSSIRYFSSVNVQLTPSADSAAVDCAIRIQPSNPRGVRFNIEASTNSNGLVGLSPQIGFYHKNIFHGGEWLNVGLMGNFQMKVGKNLKVDRSVRSTEFGVTSSISFPKLLGFPVSRFRGRTIPRTDVALSYNFQDRPEYTRNILSTSFSYIGNYRSRIWYQISPLSLSVVRIYDLKDSFRESMRGNPFLANAYQDHFDAGATMMLYHTTNSDANPTTSYRYSRLQVDASGNVLALAKGLMKKDAGGAGMIWDTPFAQYIRVEGSVGRTWTFGEEDRHAFATRLLAGFGYAYGNSTTLPFEKQFYGGGAGSLRGWQTRSVGPGRSALNKTFVIPNQTGDVRLEANVEYRFPLFWRLKGCLFADAGNVWNTSSTATDELAVLTLKDFGESLAVAWGTGIRVDLSYILLRIDLGFRLHDPARTQPWCKPNQWFDSNGYALHFGVGYPF